MSVIIIVYIDVTSLKKTVATVEPPRIWAVETFFLKFFFEDISVNFYLMEDMNINFGILSVS